VDSVDSVDRETVAEFWPPNALPRFNAWKDEHRELITLLPDEAVRFDIGRATGGSFARVRIATEHAPRFRQALRQASVGRFLDRSGVIPEHWPSLEYSHLMGQRIALSALATATVLGVVGCGASHRYTVKQVEQAFVAEGVQLRRTGAQPSSALVILRHGSKAHFVWVAVLVVPPQQSPLLYFDKRRGDRFTKHGNVFASFDPSNASTVEAAMARLH
jgi:hypothetical protein